MSGIEVQDPSKGENDVDIFVDLSLSEVSDKKVSKKSLRNSAEENMKKREKIALGFENFDSKIYTDLCRVYAVTQQVRTCIFSFANCLDFNWILSNGFILFLSSLSLSMLFVPNTLCDVIRVCQISKLPPYTTAINGSYPLHPLALSPPLPYSLPLLFSLSFSPSPSLSLTY